MKRLLKKGAVLVVGFICLLVSGCSDTEGQERLRDRESRARQACIDAGGVPLQSWFNEAVLGDCKFPQGKGK